VRGLRIQFLRANTFYEGEILVRFTSIARLLIAKRLIEIANAKRRCYFSRMQTGKRYMIQVSFSDLVLTRIEARR